MNFGPFVGFVDSGPDLDPGCFSDPGGFGDSAPDCSVDLDSPDPASAVGLYSVALVVAGSVVGSVVGSVAGLVFGFVDFGHSAATGLFAFVGLEIVDSDFAPSVVLTAVVAVADFGRFVVGPAADFAVGFVVDSVGGSAADLVDSDLVFVAAVALGPPVAFDLLNLAFAVDRSGFAATALGLEIAFPDLIFPVAGFGESFAFDLAPSSLGSSF